MLILELVLPLIVLFADYSDPDVIRAGDDYWLVASSFDAVPALPILHSRDLKSWTLVGHAAEKLPFEPEPGGGVWAPSIRQHGGWFWIYFGDPDRGIFMTRARDPRGPWEPLTLVKEAKGWIDPCPLWDDDGSMYLVHAWAKSRAGFNSVLTVNRMSADGRRVVDDGTIVFDGREHHPTIEGPKFYKRNGWYYIFAPAGGVKRGWQTVLRSRNVLGPYEAKVVLEDGLHQGAWVEDSFLHFQDLGAYGRVVHRQPLKWVNDWPEIDPVDGVLPSTLQASDEFDGSRLGLQWQWTKRAQPHALRNGTLRLSGGPLLQKLPAPAFTATTRVLRARGRAGLIVAGTESASIDFAEAPYLRVTITPHAVARFSTSRDGKTFTPSGKPFVARPGRWIGAKVGLFGDADFDFFRVEPFTPAETASLVVAQDGSGDFRTIQEAVDAIPEDNDDHHVILIRSGTYREKVLLTKSRLSLAGEDREKTLIAFAELRRNWRASHPDDWGAAVINIADGVTDVTIANLTVHNDYGSRNGGDDDHQFAIRSMGTSTRIAILDANVIADGGDTVSLWNAESGLSYYAGSYFEGHVDFMAPRGWAYATNCRFFGRNLTASIWHDGSKDPDQKLVIRHSRFDGIPNFPLGRNHRDAQFFIVDSILSANTADRAIYAASTLPPRQFYANVRRDGGNYAWHSDNLPVREEDVTATWTFGGRWDPAKIPPVLPYASIPYPENGARRVDPNGVTLRWTPSRNPAPNRVSVWRRPPSAAGDVSRWPREATSTQKLEPGTTYTWRVDDGPIWSFTTDDRATRIALAGDSTVTDKQGWGRGFRSFVHDSAALFNEARGGRSSKSFLSEGHWSAVLAKKPTHVLIQFGHNDQPGKGADRETDLPAYKTNLARYVDDARAIGAKPILITPLARRNPGPSDLEAWADATKEVALAKQVPLIDLHAESFGVLNPALGPDRTHLNAEGSEFFGAFVAEEVRRAAPELVAYVRAPKARRRVPEPWSMRMADSVMKRTPDPMWLDANDAPRWEYTPGLVLKGIQHVAEKTGEERYWKYVTAYYDGMIADDGSIKGGYRKDDYNIDRINPGKPLFALYARTKNEKYRKAIENLRQQMREHPRTKEGGFWHKKRYPHQMWLDGLYMGAPFLAQYAKTFNEPALLDDVITQFVLMEKHARDEKTGLLFHGWDESRQQKWSDPKTGRSPAFWGRAMGWYAMGLVETLDFIPLEHPRRRELLGILNRLAEAVTKVQDPKTGVWWQVVDQPGREGNYLEASVSSMLAFALLKSTRLRYLPESYEAVARRAYEGVLEQFIEVDKDGEVHIHHVCQVAGLGGDPEKGERYRDGTYQYYVTEKIRSNDPKAVGPFLFASLEMERRKK
jgi:unsaturated rhamnogalacturonyl hydrolase